MTTATFNRQLDERGLPRQFANINLASFTCPELCKVIKLFDEFARGLSDQRKIQLAARLIQLKPRPLRPAERRAVEHLWSKRLTVEQARGLLPTHRHRSTAKHRQQSNSSHGQQVTTSKAQVRPSIQLPEHNATYSSSNTSSTSQILSAIGYYPSATHYVRNPNDWLSGTTKPAIRTCETCMEDLLIIRFPVTLQGAHCQHKEAIICTECLSAYIEAQATSSPLNEIRCPEPNCNSTLDYDHMKKYAPSHLFTRYDSYLNSKALENIEDFIECSNKTCHFGGMLDVSITTYMTCPDCDTRTCTTCRTPWHPEMSHEENMAGIRRAAEEEEERVREEARKVNEEFESNKTVKVKTKACPSKKCGVRIQKNGGCDHMTCKSQLPLLPCTLTMVILTRCTQARAASTNSAGAVLPTTVQSAGVATTTMTRSASTIVSFLDRIRHLSLSPVDDHDRKFRYQDQQSCRHSEQQYSL